MIDVAAAVRSHLLADSGVSALAGTRGYTLKFPENFAGVGFRVSIVDEVRASHLAGPDSQRRSRVQIDAVAPESGGTAYAIAGSLADAIDAAMTDGTFVATSSGSPGASLEVKVVDRPQRIPFYDPDELRQVRVVQDYIVWSRPV
jgi:hypothetical protein